MIEKINKLEIPKVYDPKDIEKKWYEIWLDKKIFHSEPDDKKPFTIVIPPPNVTGSLHMGHALNNLLQDIIIRFKKMNGFNVCWVPGTDHGGIATQNVMEKELKKEGKKRDDFTREEFVKKMVAWAQETSNTIINQLKRLGCSCDWERICFTMDKKCSNAVNTAFIDFYKKGLIYRGERIVDWCPRCGTALNESEVEQEDEKGKLWYIKYPLTANHSPLTDFITVATTRPETMLGDTAVAVNPNDERYKKYIGKNVILPLVNRIIPIIADEIVDPKFGTGAVKVTPAHDKNDAEIAKRHALKFIHAIDKEAKITDFITNTFNSNIPQDTEIPKLIGKDRYEARKILIERLKEKKLLEKEEDYTLPITRCYRCETPTEPLISEQWFLRMAEMAKRAIKSETKFFPGKWLNPYLLWLENLKDWCISRQIWWGHQIPLWYCMNCCKNHIIVSFSNSSNPNLKGKGGLLGLFIDNPPIVSINTGQIKKILPDKISPKDLKKEFSSITIFNIPQNLEGVYTSIEEPNKCSVCGKSDFFQDPDVLDTWFSSALWPMSVFNWPTDAESVEVKSEKLKVKGEQRTPSADLDYYYPTNVLVTAHEILYLWVARMIMFGLEFKKQVPYKDVYIHGMVRDSKGKKMSKSLGNVIDPLDIMEKYGTDALRFALAYQGIPGRDMQISDENFIMARNFCNKIWNVSRFVLMNLGTQIIQIKDTDCADMELTDKWILSELNLTIKNVAEAIENYNPAEASRLLYEFIWSKYCDWYVEFSKTRFYGNNDKAKLTALKVHLEVLEKILKMLHPVMPFITEEIFQGLTEKKYASIVLTQFPEYDESEINKDAQRIVQKIISIITVVRNIRLTKNIKSPDFIDIHLKTISENEKMIRENESYIKSLAKVREITFFTQSSKRPELSVSAVADEGIEIFVILKDKIDFEKEKTRLMKEVEKIDAELSIVNKKIENKNFISKAKESEVEKVRQKHKELLDKRNLFEKNLSDLSDRPINACDFIKYQALRSDRPTRKE